MSGATTVLVVVTALGAACTGGALYAFSSLVMPALERVSAGRGAFHVPRNDALAALVPDAPGTTDAWRTYLREWTAANHVRAAAALLAAAAFVNAVRVG